MIVEFNNKWEEEYKIKTVAGLQPLIDKRNAAHKKNAQTVRDRNTAADIAEAAADGDDDDEKGKSEEGETEHEDKDGEGGGGQEHNCKNGDRRAAFTSHKIWAAMVTLAHTNI